MEPKIRANSLVDIHSNSLMNRILDRSHPIDNIVEKITENWRYDIDKRHPSPALNDDGIFTSTDLDLATFLQCLLDRNAVIILPHYEARRASVNTGEQVLSNKRYGKVTGLVGNQETFSFSVRIFDQAVMKADGNIGNFRNFMLTDFDGKFYSGWECIEWKPDAHENDFLTKNELWTGSQVVFKNFVAPQRWVSLYGQHYFILKAALKRIKDECSFIGDQMKLMMEKGFSLPEKEPSEFEREAGESRAIQVMAYIFDVDMPDWTSEYKKCKASNENLLKLYERKKWLTYTIAPQLRFIARTIELAWVNMSKNQGNDDFFPVWIKNCKWKSYVDKRTEWNRLIFGQEAVGKLGYGICYRVKEKTERVAI